MLDITAVQCVLYVRRPEYGNYALLAHGNACTRYARPTASASCLSEILKLAVAILDLDVVRLVGGVVAPIPPVAARLHALGPIA